MKTKKRRIGIWQCGLALILVLGFVCLDGAVMAVPIDTHYTVTATPTPLGGNSWQYSYEVYNVNGGGWGLDGFIIQVPITANISNITDPPCPLGYDYWSHGFSQAPLPSGLPSSNWSTSASLQSGYQWLWWWGFNWGSVYPVGSTAHFNFVANAPPGVNQGVAVTWWGPYDNPNIYTAYEGSMISPVCIEVVSIDIKPGSDVNSINPRSRGKIPVAILSIPGFYAPERVDLSSLTFGRTGNESSLAFCTIKDANGDAVADVVGHFYTQATGFETGDTQGLLKGQTVDDIPISGSDSVRIVPGK